jgi:hypothetical protein
LPDDMIALRSAWESFYVILGSSAAALTGLQFVVIALIADSARPATSGEVGAFGTPTVVHFCVALFVSLLLSAPWPTVAPVALLLGITGVGGLGYTMVVVRRARAQAGYQPVVEDWVFHAFLPFVGYSALLAGAARLEAAPIATLFVVAGASLLLVYVGIHNAWDTVTYIAVSQRKRRAT